MYKFCPECNLTVAYDPYFKAYVCRHCGWYEYVDIFNLETQKIGIDKSNGLDYSAATSICGSCNYVIDTKLFKPEENDLNITVYKKCPKCGVEFKKHTILE